MQFFAEYGLFLAKTATLVIAVLVVAIGLFVIASRGKGGPNAAGRPQVQRHAHPTRSDAVEAVNRLRPAQGIGMVGGERGHLVGGSSVGQMGKHSRQVEAPTTRCGQSSGFPNEEVVSPIRPMPL